MKITLKRSENGHVLVNAFGHVSDNIILGRSCLYRVFPVFVQAGRLFFGSWNFYEFTHFWT